MNIFTWTSGCIKYTDWIIILIYWSCIWPHLWFFNWSNVLTTFLIIHFSPWQNLCFFLAMTYFSPLCDSSISSQAEISESVVTCYFLSITFVLSLSSSLSFVLFYSIKLRLFSLSTSSYTQYSISTGDVTSRHYSITFSEVFQLVSS